MGMAFHSTLVLQERIHMSQGGPLSFLKKLVLDIQRVVLHNTHPPTTPSNIHTLPTTKRRRISGLRAEAPRFVSEIKNP